MLTKKTKYALKALLRLGLEYEGDPLLISDIAEKENIPKKFLEQILLQLKLDGLLDSRPGRGGGYRLRKPPSQILIGPVIRRMDGPLAPIPCVSVTAYSSCQECVDEETCGIRILMKQVRDATAQILDHTTLQEMIGRKRAGSSSKKVKHGPKRPQKIR